MDIFVARQPIFNERKNVVAYEILYRSDHRNVYDVTLDGDHTSAMVVTDTILNFGLDQLTGGKKAFINFTHNLIMDDLPLLFHPQDLTIEILETVEVDDALVEKCKMLKSKGYTIALDDFVGGEEYDHLMPYIDIIKVDFLVLQSHGRKYIAEKYKALNVTLLAEKVESYVDFNEAVSFGYELFQGFFFEKPVVCQGKVINTMVTKYFEIIKETISEDADFNRLSEIVKSDVSLTYKLLRLINSPAFYTVSQITSVNHAMTLLGINEIRKWATLIMLRDMSGGKPDEVIRNSLVRAIFSEMIAEYFELERRKTEVFLLGLFSLIDTIMEKPLFDILDQLPLKDDLKDALLGADNAFHVILRLVKYYEAGNWEMVTKVCEGKRVSVAAVNLIYMKALGEASKRMNGMIG